MAVAHSGTTNLAGLIDSGWALVRETPGYLTEREARFLMTAMALAPATGANVEIGSFKGRSTVGLAFMASRLDLGPVVAIDPHSCPSPTDPRLIDQTSTYDDFLGNVARAGVRDVVRPVQAFSGEVAKTWRDPIRFLWIDGDHSYEGARADVRDFAPFLVSGAVMAMHDVLGTWAGTLRVFEQDVLRSSDFGPAGFCGSIAWAQYRPREGDSVRRRLEHAALSLPVRRLIPVADRGKAEFGEEKLIRLHGADKWRYKFWRTMLPHGAVRPRALARRLGIERVSNEAFTS
jgi:hypothetical protein